MPVRKPEIRVSFMETGGGDRPSPDEAGETLRRLTEDENAVRYPPLPRWFFVLMASLVAAASLVQVLPPSDSAKASLGLAIVAVVPAYRYWLHREGVSWVSIKVGDLLGFLAVILGTVTASAIVSGVTGWWWPWVVSAVVTAGVVLYTGHVYRRSFGG